MASSTAAELQLGGYDPESVDEEPKLAESLVAEQFIVPVSNIDFGGSFKSTPMTSSSCNTRYVP